MLRKYAMRVLGATVCAAMLVQSTFALAQPQKVSNKELYSFLAKSNTNGTLRGSDIKKYPKLAAILDLPIGDAPVDAQEFQQRFDRYVASLAMLFASLDLNKDGKLSLLEVAQTVPKFLVYFPYVDLNRDGAITFDELLSSRLVFRIPANGGSKSLASSNATPEIAGSSIRHGELSKNSADLAGESPDSLFDAFVASETAKLESFFANNQQKEGEPDKLDLVVVTGSNYQSSSGFYPTYGMWVNKQDALNVDNPDSAITRNALCKGAAAGLAALGCYAVTAACVGVTAITFGGFAFPCAVAIPAVCVFTATAAAIVAEGCPAD